MHDHWRHPGFTVPNAATYPWQWLWDSCFHSLIWAELGEPERALDEVEQALRPIDDAGFVPHMIYHDDPHARSDFWGRAWTSSITQPPMYGHTLAELFRRGIDPPADLVERARRGLTFLVETRARRPSGLIAVVHPWETGCDDSPRWDGWIPAGWSRDGFKVVKGELMATIERTPGGAPIANPAFDVAPVSFNALVAFNAAELAALTGDDLLRIAAHDLARLLEAQWHETRRTWNDDGPEVSRVVRTADALLPLLVVDEADQVEGALAELAAPDAFGGPVGPPGVHPAEPLHDPDAYWRGPVWPQIAYLLWTACVRRDRTVAADRLAEATIAGAVRSGFAESWRPDDGAARGAVPQSWAGLILLMGAEERAS